MKNITRTIASELFKPRRKESHKGTYGHSLLIAGSKGRMGAAVIAARACLRSGTGLLTVQIPKDERNIIQTAIPEAMLIFRENKLTRINDFNAVGIGPALGTGKASEKLLNTVICTYDKPLVLDADAISIIALYKNWLNKIPPGSIFTPHVKEFDRLFGTHDTDAERIKAAIKIAGNKKIIMVLKGPHTLVTDGKDSFKNTNGNAGLAKGGSGDALTGIITALMAQAYTPMNAAVLGVYLHGMAADIAIKEQSMESLLATDLIENLGKVFRQFNK